MQPVGTVRSRVLAGPRAARRVRRAQTLPAVSGPPGHLRHHLVRVLRLRLALPLHLPLDRPPRRKLPVHDQQVIYTLYYVQHYIPLCIYFMPVGLNSSVHFAEIL